jgi:hypothetical protein
MSPLAQAQVRMAGQCPCSSVGVRAAIARGNTRGTQHKSLVLQNAPSRARRKRGDDQFRLNQVGLISGQEPTGFYTTHTNANVAPDGSSTERCPGFQGLWPLHVRSTPCCKLAPSVALLRPSHHFGALLLFSRFPNFQPKARSLCTFVPVAPWFLSSPSGPSPPRIFSVQRRPDISRLKPNEAKIAARPRRSPELRGSLIRYPDQRD